MPEKKTKKKKTLAEHIANITDNIWDIGFEIIFLIFALSMLYWIGTTALKAIGIL
jgi:hypothetical protein